MILAQFLKEILIFSDITFVESSHSYLIGGHPSNSSSVTGTLKQFKKQFEKDKIASRVAKKKNQTVKQVLHEWETINKLSTTTGSMLHKYIENFYNNKRLEFEGSFEELGYDEKKKILEIFPKLVEYFLAFYADHKHLVPIKNEMVIGDIKDTRICGTLDLLSYNLQEETFEILDFKTNKKMEKTSSWGNLLYPFDDMTEGEVNEYTIQLNCYKYIIEKYTTIKISKMKLIWFNVNNEGYEIIELKEIQPKIKLMFDKIKSLSLFGNI